ncbi:MAG: UbiX family flavin prenyltransferase [Candidatus Omnitrophica bacterium]|nr:UbiX family flavin prenyltransferase [Candidatus Omnitrophota bacterium]
MKPYVVAMTGASGVVYGRRCVEILAELGHKIVLVVSRSARLILTEELHIPPGDFTRVEHFTCMFRPDILEHLKVYSPDEFTSPLASGSYPIQGMIIIPCSMRTLGAIASGAGENLIHRAADCTIKEGRPLILVPRETPLHAIHLENMLRLARLGVRIVPAAPAFYGGVQSFDGMIDFVVGKVFDQLGLEHALSPRWIGSECWTRSD